MQTSGFVSIVVKWLFSPRPSPNDLLPCMADLTQSPLPPDLSRSAWQTHSPLPESGYCTVQRVSSVDTVLLLRPSIAGRSLGIARLYVNPCECLLLISLPPRCYRSLWAGRTEPIGRMFYGLSERCTMTHFPRLFGLYQRHLTGLCSCQGAIATILPVSGSICNPLLDPTGLHGDSGFTLSVPEQFH